VHPTEHHGITARQAARIQTFPDDYVFHGGLIASGKQIGNAVPVALGRAIIEHISTYLLGQDVCVKDSETKSNQLSECA
jgi:DNA (cytosine-5)-methyltransferase 1